MTQFRDDRYRVFSHPDGGFYVRVEEEMESTVKMDDGRWEPAVHYRPVQRLEGGGFCFTGRKLFTTTEARWAERFTEIAR